MKKSNTIILSCFPLVGRTWLAKNQAKYNITVVDSDSSRFSSVYRKRTPEELEVIRKDWDSVPHLLSGVGYINHIKNELIMDHNSEFPSNYINHIKLHMGEEDIILVSTNYEARKAMQDYNIPYTIVMPSEDLYCEWIGRAYLARQEGNKKYNADIIQRFWNIWISNCKSDPADKIIIDKPNKFLCDIIPEVIKSFKEI